MGFPAVCKTIALNSCRSTTRDFAHFAQPTLTALNRPNYATSLNCNAYPFPSNSRHLSFKANSFTDEKTTQIHKRHNMNSFKSLQLNDSLFFSQRGRCYSSSNTPSTEDLTYVEDPFKHVQVEPRFTSPVPLRVIVIGWMGCKKRYIEKFARLWAQSGDHEVIVLRPSILQTVWPFFGIVSGGKAIDKVAKLQRENPDMPTVYHIFSTGGFIMAGTMWKWLEEIEDVAVRRHMAEDVQAIIFDSGPAPVRPDMASRAIASALTLTPAELVDKRHGWLVEKLRTFLDWWLSRESVLEREREVLESWYYFSPRCPQLYLYGDKDPLVSVEDVEGYRRVQASRGVLTRAHAFVGGTHVELFRQSPHEYVHRVSEFLAQNVRRAVSYNGALEDEAAHDAPHPGERP